MLHREGGSVRNQKLKAFDCLAYTIPDLSRKLDKSEIWRLDRHLMNPAELTVHVRRCQWEMLGHGHEAVCTTLASGRQGCSAVRVTSAANCLKTNSACPGGRFYAFTLPEALNMCCIWLFICHQGFDPLPFGLKHDSHFLPLPMIVGGSWKTSLPSFVVEVSVWAVYFQVNCTVFSWNPIPLPVYKG